MRSIKKIIIFLITFLSFISYGYAASWRYADQYIYARDGFQASTDFFVRDSSSYGWQYPKYNFSTSNSNKSGYCLNAGKTTGKISGETTTYEKEDTLMDLADESDESRWPYEAGIVAILSTSKSEVEALAKSEFPNATSISEDKYHTILTIALRVYEMYWPSGTNAYTSGCGTEDQNCTFNAIHRYWAKTWANNSYGNLISAATGSAIPSLNYVNEPTMLVGDGQVAFGDVASNTLLNPAKALVKKGLEAARDFDYDKVASFDIVKVGAGVTSIDENNRRHYTETYNLEIKNFSTNNNNTILNLAVMYPATSIINSYRMYIQNGNNEIAINNYSNIFENNEIKSLLNNGTGTLKLKVEFVTNSSNCNDITYSINYSWHDPSIPAVVAQYKAVNTGNEAQNFMVVWNNEGVFTGSVEQTFNFCGTPTTTPSCDDLANDCNNSENPNSTECNRYLNQCGCPQLETQCERDKNNNNSDSPVCKEYENHCSTTVHDTGCMSFVSQTTCRPNASEFDIGEGYQSDSTCGSISEDKLNIKECILNNSDENGNSYEATNLVEENPYCKVFCKEDYHFNMPGNQNTNSIGYLKLEATITGTKTCYTDEIKTEQFKEDLDADSKALIDAYNLYKFYNAAVGSTESRTRWYGGDGNDAFVDNDRHATARCHVNVDGLVFENEFREYCPEGAEEGDCEDIEVNGETISVKTEIECQFLYNQYGSAIYGKNFTDVPGDSADGGAGYTYNWEFEFTDGGNTNMRNFISTIGTGSGTRYSFSCEKKNGTESTITCTFRGRGGNASCSSDNFIGDRHSCWSGTSAPRPDGTSGVFASKLSTARTDLNNKNTKIENDKRNYNACSNWSVNYDFDPKVSFDYEEKDFMDRITDRTLETVGSITRTSQTNDKCNGEVFSDDDNSYNQCSNGWNSSNTVFTKNILVCSGTSCRPESVDFVDAKYIKKSETKVGSYQTRTVALNIYPHGGLGLNPQGNVENGSYLQNKLPIGSTLQGFYNYALIVENLGEYYNNGNKGRIWGSSESIVSYNLSHKSACYDNSALDRNGMVGSDNHPNSYVCQYSVNIPDDDDTTCPDCPIECDPSGCYYDDPQCPHCPIECPTCLYNGDINVENRPITPNDLNPNDRELGRNWNTNNGVVRTSIQLKANVTTSEIEAAGNSIYDSGNDNVVEINLNSRMIAWIKDYNSNNSYANNTLKCYDYIDSSGRVLYENVFCYSTFIDELINAFGNQVIVPNSRGSIDSNWRQVNSTTSGYWTPWPKVSTTWATEFSMAQDRFNTLISQIGSSYGVGPSWK